MMARYNQNIHNLEPSSVDEEHTLFQQFVEDVTDFTSQYGTAGSISYTAHNIIGKPRIYPEYGDFPQAFIMRTYGRWWDSAPSRTHDLTPQNYGNIRSQDYVDLYFERKVFAISVSIYETYNPGAVVRIWACDGNCTWVVLWQGAPSVPVKHEATIFSPPIKTAPFPTNLLRIEFDHRHLGYHTELDAVLLTGSTEPPIEKLLRNLGSGELTRKVMSLNLHRVTTSPSAEEQDTVLKIAESPFNMLPAELVFQVLSWLDLRSLCRCACVSRRFLLAASDPALYVQLNLKAYWWTVRSSCLISLVSRCSRLQALDLSWCGNRVADFALSFIRFIEDCGSSLKILRLNNCKFIDKECIIAISETCLNLQELSVRCVNLTEGWSELSSLVHLTRLDFYHSPVQGRELLMLLPYLGQLRHLGLGATSLGLDLDHVMAVLAINCPHLCSLDLWKAHSLSASGLNSLAKLHNLLELDLGWCCDIETPADSLRTLILGCPKIRKLFLSALRGVTEQDLRLLAEHCPQLEQLDLLGARGITPEICLRLLGQCKQLRLLDVNYCDHISEVHVQQWRPLFPHVTIQCSKPEVADE